MPWFEFSTGGHRVLSYGHRVSIAAARALDHYESENRFPLATHGDVWLSAKLLPRKEQAALAHKPKTIVHLIE